MTRRDGVTGVLDGKSATLFLLGGLLMVAFATNTTLTTFTGSGYPVIQSVAGPAGFALGTLALFGLYPTLAERTPRLARVAAAVAVFPAIGWTVIVLGGVATTAGVLPAEASPPVVIPIGTIATTLLAFLLFGITTLRADAHSRLVGILLLVPAAMFVLLMARLAPPFVIDSGHLVGILGTGIALRASDTPAERGDPTFDATP